MRTVDTYIEFINEEFFKKIFNKKKTTKSSKNIRIDTCVYNIISFLSDNGIYDWNDFMSMSVFDREVVNKIIDHEVKDGDEMREVRFLIKIELSDVPQLREYLKELERVEEFERCAKVIKKISSKQ